MLLYDMKAYDVKAPLNTISTAVLFQRSTEAPKQTAVYFLGCRRTLEYKISMILIGD